MEPLLPLPSDDSLPDEIRATLAKLPPANVFRMLGNTPASFDGFVRLALSILAQSEFDPRKREIAVLRVAHVTRAPYEWHQHRQIAERAGVTQAEIDAIACDGPVRGLDEEGQLLCRVADEISRDVRLSDAALEQIVERYGVRQASELILCCSYFNMVSRYLESMRVPFEDASIFDGDDGQEAQR